MASDWADKKATSIVCRVGIFGTPADALERSFAIALREARAEGEQRAIAVADEHWSLGPAIKSRLAQSGEGVAANDKG